MDNIPISLRRDDISNVYDVMFENIHALTGYEGNCTANSINLAEHMVQNLGINHCKVGMAILMKPTQKLKPVGSF